MIHCWISSDAKGAVPGGGNEMNGGGEPLEVPDKREVQLVGSSSVLGCGCVHQG